MRSEKNDGRYTLSSGKEIRANRGIFGISPSLGMFEGYDGDIQVGELDMGTGKWTRLLSDEDVREIATAMIQRWDSLRRMHGWSGSPTGGAP